MEIGEYGYKKPELINVSEQIYEWQEEKRRLEFELSSEQFHYSYIPKRKKMVKSEVMIRLFYIIPLTLLLRCCITFVNGFLVSGIRTDPVLSVGFFCCVIMIAFGGYADIKLLIHEFRMLFLLGISALSKVSGQAGQFAKNHGIHTFQSDEYQSREKIKWLEMQIESNENKITELLQRRQKILDESTKEEIASVENENFSKEGLQENVQDGKFILRKVSKGTENAAQLHEFYLREEQYITQHLIALDGKLHQIDKKIVAIEDDFEKVKREIKVSLILFILLIVIQGTFSGIMAIVTNFICLIVSLVYVFYAESKWKQPVLLYLIENDSNLTKEYAFCNGILPVKVKRDEVLEETNNLKKELADIKEKKESIIFS